MNMVILSAILYLVYIALVFALLIRLSSFVAAIALLATPILLLLISPERSIAFLAHQHLALGNGILPVHNLHILLFIWSSLLAIILYTEFITWYLGRGGSEGEGSA